jgi:diguanylate cyclase (GGDEF)-like protein
MSKKAWIYISSIYLIGVILSILILTERQTAKFDWVLCVILTLLATLGQLFKTEAPTHQLYHPALVFIFAGVLLLEPAQFVLLVLISHLFEWVKERILKSSHLKSWYIQPFNISMHILIGFTAYQVYHLLNPGSEGFASGHALAAASAAAVLYVLLNHLIVGLVLILARKVRLRESGILDPESLIIDLVMLSLGIVVAALVRVSYWFLLPAITPLYLISRALAIPILKQQVNTDSKTGLWNYKYFMTALESEISRASRSSQLITVVVADLDLLRNINNAYGHLAGDVVLIGVANILKEHVRDYDVVARMGGEEFAILMPEISPENAYSRIESIREQIYAYDFRCPVTQALIKATMSFGVAGLGETRTSARDIIHAADIAVYEAKINGRNRTCVFSEDMANMLGIRNLHPESIYL